MAAVQQIHEEEPQEANQMVPSSSVKHAYLSSSNVLEV